MQFSNREQSWFQKEPARSISIMKLELLGRIWAPGVSKRVLQLDCSNLAFLEWFASAGHQVTSLGSSQDIITWAKERLQPQIAIDMGRLDELPYHNNEFDVVALIHCLEFAQRPEKIIEEAVRVAREQVLIGFSNKYSIASCCSYLETLWKLDGFSHHVKCYSVFQVKKWLEQILGGSCPTKWRSCLTLPQWSLRYTKGLERSRFFQFHPFGNFVAMRVDLRYLMHTVQDPLLPELSAGTKTLPFHTSCWRDRQPKNFPSLPCSHEIVPYNRSDGQRHITFPTA